MSIQLGRSVRAALVLLAAGYMQSAAALQVAVTMSGLALDGDSNVGNPSKSTAGLNFIRETQVITGDFGPLFDAVHASGTADGVGGTLGASITMSNPSGTAGNGSMLGGRITSLVRENIRLVSVVSSVPDGFHSGLIGLGDPNDDFWTVQASAKLFGSTSVGSATGVPDGKDPGSALGELVLRLGLNGVGRGGLFESQFTNIGGTLVEELANESNSGGVTVTVDKSTNTVTMTVPKDLLVTGSIFFEAQLAAEYTSGNFPGSEELALFGHTAYLDFQVEDGAAWRPNSNVNRDFLSAPIAPPSAVPLPASAWLAVSGLGFLLARAKRA